MDTVSEASPMTETLDALQPLYTITEAEEVSAMLRADPALVPLLLEAAAQLQRYFPGARLSLQWTIDPEEPIEQLFVGAHTDLPLDEAMERLRQFDRVWWLKNGLRAPGKVCIDFES